MKDNVQMILAGIMLLLLLASGYTIEAIEGKDSFFRALTALFLTGALIISEILF